MSIDLMIVDDDETILKAMVKIAEIKNLNCVTFNSGLKAIKFIRETIEKKLPPPIAYLIDMRTTNNMNDLDELDSPENIFWYLAQMGAINYLNNEIPTNFVFYTGHFREGEHDEIVQKRTNAPVYIKAMEMGKIYDYFNRISSSKEISF